MQSSSASSGAAAAVVPRAPATSRKRQSTSSAAPVELEDPSPLTTESASYKLRMFELMVELLKATVEKERVMLERDRVMLERERGQASAANGNSVRQENRQLETVEREELSLGESPVPKRQRSTAQAGAKVPPSSRGPKGNAAAVPEQPAVATSSSQGTEENAAAIPEQPAVATAVLPSAEASVQTLTLGVKDQSGEVVHFAVKATTRFRAIVRAYAHKKNISEDTVRLMYSGRRIVDSFTPEDLRLSDNENIDVVFQQEGC